MRIFIRFFVCCLLPTAYCCFSACSNDTLKENKNTATSDNTPALPPAPSFNEDSAYAFVKAQVDLAPVFREPVHMQNALSI